jgi:hypothetical protein
VLIYAEELMILKRLGPLSFAKVSGLLYGIFGLVAGCVCALISLVGGVASDEPGGPVFGALFGVGAVIFLPIVYGGLGFVMSLVMAGLYNVVARWVGGVEIQIEQVGASSTQGV